MNIQLKAVAATLAGVGIGVAAMHGLQGGQAKAPPAFVISNIEVTDPAGYQKYGEAAAAVVATTSASRMIRRLPEQITNDRLRFANRDRE
jgi:hypothetical protein